MKDYRTIKEKQISSIQKGLAITEIKGRNNSPLLKVTKIKISILSTIIFNP